MKNVNKYQNKVLFLHKYLKTKIMTSTKFNNETINLEILKTGYGHWKFTIDNLEGKFTCITTDSMLVDAINSNEFELTRYGTIQDAIDNAVEMVLKSNDINY